MAPAVLVWTQDTFLGRTPPRPTPTGHRNQDHQDPHFECSAIFCRRAKEPESSFDPQGQLAFASAIQSALAIVPDLLTPRSLPTRRTRADIYYYDRYRYLNPSSRMIGASPRNSPDLGLRVEHFRTLPEKQDHEFNFSEPAITLRMPRVCIPSTVPTQGCLTSRPVRACSMGCPSAVIPILTSPAFHLA